MVKCDTNNTGTAAEAWISRLELVAPAADGLRFMALGQALIEHDPRSFMTEPMMDVIEVLAEADVVFTNLEVAIDGVFCPCKPLRTDIYSHSAKPDVLAFLRHAKVNLLALSNNHSFDLRRKGIQSTVHAAREHGFVHAGLGNAADASSGSARFSTGSDSPVRADSTVSKSTASVIRASAERTSP